MKFREVDGRDPGYVDDGCLEKASGYFGKYDVTRCPAGMKVRGQHHHDHRSDRASVTPRSLAINALSAFA